MKISTQTRYAIRFLMELTLFEGREPVTERLTTEEIAERQGLSEKYLESIAAKLRKAGFITSVRGVNGGYTLAKNPVDITVGSIMRVMESTYFAVHCNPAAETCCINGPECLFATFFSGLEKVISDYVDNVTLDDLRKKMQENPESSLMRSPA